MSPPRRVWKHRIIITVIRGQFYMVLHKKMCCGYSAELPSGQMILTSIHSICFYEEMWRIIPKLSSCTHLICFFEHELGRDIKTRSRSKWMPVWFPGFSCLTGFCEVILNTHKRPAKIQINLGIRPVWSESSLSAWRKLGSLASHWAHSEDSD